MKNFMLLLLLTCVFLATTNGDVQNSEQENRLKLVSQRIRSLRDSLGIKLPVDSKKPKPVAPVGDEDDEDPWDFGAFFGEFSKKVGAVVKNAVGDLMECVDNVFKCLRPGDDKKDKKKKNTAEAGAAAANSKPKPAEAVKPVEPVADGDKGSVVASKPALEKLTEALAKPAELVGGAVNAVKEDIAPEKPAPIIVDEKVDTPKVDKVKPIDAIVDNAVKPKP
ncbi:uncharacterized protein LOC105219939 [Zeugodacus cucurbitae]|uniref:uncharacterized protein LOC105219939 n=1 Tax=Zeugodacus cucurbitae TaxID=28588 RepID=UPI000596A96A|nr:uncharacterized protein LOC105219939 [Zeugodacus cucurbitae]XP_011194598.1 uncharacterized protein LOC105219939 [Zeugodacus cucurbitae]